MGVVADPMVQQLAALTALQGAWCSGSGDAGLPPEAECKEDVAACGAPPWRQGNGAPGYDGGDGGGYGKGASSSSVAPSSIRSGSSIPRGVWLQARFW